MITSYLNQTVSHQAQSGRDEYNQTTFSTAVSIAAKFEYSRKIIIDRKGNEVVSDASCFTAVEVNPGDIIVYDGVSWIVAFTDELCGLYGTVEFYESRLTRPK